MIYEFRTYGVKVGVLADVLERFGAGYDTRKDIHPLAAFWCTEIGPMNQIIQVWPWRDMAHRDSVRTEVNKLPTWPPGLGDAVVHQEVELFNAFPFADKMQPGNPGPVYEMRTDRYPPGKVRGLRGEWEKLLSGAGEALPITAVMHTDMGALNKIVHIWAFESLEQRSEILAGSNAAGIWSTEAIQDAGGAAPDMQFSKIMRPSAFSPMQ
jgi:hypothetical protein